MRRSSGVLGVVATAIALTAVPRAARGQDPDTTLARIEKLLVAGDRSSARALTDSLLSILPPESPRVPDALYWRAQSATSAADAERDYLRISLEHPFAARAPDALLSLGQLEFARGDRIAARRRFDRLLRDYPTGKHVGRAGLWSGRLALEDRDYAAGCATLTSSRAQVAATDVELGNQYDYYIGQCDRAPLEVPPDSATPPAPAAASTPASRTASGTQYSVQVAAYSARRDATALAARLKARGFDVRVVGDKAPYRVRIGRYPTREAAVTALGRMRASQVSGIVVEAEK